MTWDYEWGYKDKSICRGSICKEPFFSGETEPDVKLNAKICKLPYGQTCIIKHVRYDKYDKKTPTFVARYCGQGQVTKIFQPLNNSFEPLLGFLQILLFHHSMRPSLFVND